MNLQEERLSGKHVFKGRIIDLEVDQIQLPDGHNSIREVINHPGGVAIAALNERDELLMVRQFRYPFRTVLLELPLEAAKREQKEETGTQAEEYLSLGKYFATPAYCTEQIYLWACRVTAFGEQHLDEGEFLEVVTVPLEKAVAMVLNKEIPDGKTQVGILKTYVLVKGGKL